MSSSSFGPAWAPSTTSSAPASCDMRAISSIGLTVPSTFETWATQTSFGPRSSSAAKASMSSRPSSVIGAQSRWASFSWATWYQGTTFEWCSISVTTIRSPAERFVRPQE